jgi:hypothetical protein
MPSGSSFDFWYSLSLIKGLVAVPFHLLPLISLIHESSQKERLPTVIQ